jgi:large subunit ribosomal protein L4
VHGPTPHEFRYAIPAKMRTAALRETLKAKLQDQTLLCVDDLATAMSKTKEFAQVLKTLNIKGKTVAALDGSDTSITRVSRNIPFFTLFRAQDMNAYDIMRNKNVLVTRTAMNNLIDRVTK